ncbi:hypothetical protein A8H37_08925 [Burkholderia thailandensis]|nr:hypothetical protein A8H37_08925 [Burkholderia thailandensis]
MPHETHLERDECRAGWRRRPRTAAAPAAARARCGSASRILNAFRDGLARAHASAGLRETGRIEEAASSADRPVDRPFNRGRLTAG